MSRSPRPPSSPLAPDQISDASLQQVRRRLLTWFAANRRDLPWRRSREPYQILVSEVMLQQTQVDRVVPYYRSFLARFPTVATLASAPTSDVIKAWAGLGYNRRAVNLQRTARSVVDQLDGVFPRDVASLRQLPGIGPYTAGAIACFAFEQDVAFVDTNMRRVLHRLFVGVDVPTATATDSDLLQLAQTALPAGQGWTWNQALIEFGALQCTARKPACIVCPLQTCCRAYPAIQSAIAALPRGVRLKRETSFDGSNRFYRGRVVAALRELPHDVASRGLDLQTLGSLVRDDFAEADVPWLYGLVQGLAKDGLALAAEESPPYDAGPRQEPDPKNVRIKLP